LVQEIMAKLATLPEFVFHADGRVTEA